MANQRSSSFTFRRSNVFSTFKPDTPHAPPKKRYWFVETRENGGLTIQPLDELLWLPVGAPRPFSARELQSGNYKSEPEIFARYVSPMLEDSDTPLNAADPADPITISGSSTALPFGTTVSGQAHPVDLADPTKRNAPGNTATTQTPVPPSLASSALSAPGQPPHTPNATKLPASAPHATEQTPASLSSASSPLPVQTDSSSPDCASSSSPSKQAKPAIPFASLEDEYRALPLLSPHPELMKTSLYSEEEIMEATGCYEPLNIPPVDAMEGAMRGMFKSALAYVKHGEIDKGKNVLLKMTSMKSVCKEKHKHLFNEFGILLRKNGLYDLSVVFYNIALELGVRIPDENLHLNISRSLFRQQRYLACAQHLFEALHIVPGHWAVLRFLAWMQQLKVVPKEYLLDVRGQLEQGIPPVPPHVQLDPIADEQVALARFQCAQNAPLPHRPLVPGSSGSFEPSSL